MKTVCTKDNHALTNLTFPLQFRVGIIREVKSRKILGDSLTKGDARKG